MSVVTRKVDDRARVVLPEAFTGKLVLVEMMNENEVRVRLKKTPRPRPSLSELLSRVTDDNQHPPVEFGTSIGEEKC